jgi:hypothetical protein
MREDRFSISQDELEARMAKKEAVQDEPVKKAVELLEAALERVLAKLGVNIEAGDIPAQQDQLGIMITEETREEMAGINGFFIFVSRKGDLIPYGWVGAARLNTQGECFVDIQYFEDNRLEETGGIKVIH